MYGYADFGFLRERAELADTSKGIHHFNIVVEKEKTLRGIDIL
jgi:hypothetical protein